MFRAKMNIVTFVIKYLVPPAFFTIMLMVAFAVLLPDLARTDVGTDAFYLFAVASMVGWILFMQRGQQSPGE